MRRRQCFWEDGAMMAIIWLFGYNETMIFEDVDEELDNLCDRV